MAQSPESASDSAGSAYAKSWDALGALIAQGKSFSGGERNCVFLNLGAKDPSFACASGALHLDHPDDSRAVIPADWDGDGDLDLWYSNRTAPRLRFMRNDMASGTQWLALHLDGRASNRDAIGARAELTLKTADGTRRTLWRRVKAGDGFLSQTPKSLHFGFRAGEKIERLLIRWPAPGMAEQIVSVEANDRWKITEGCAPERLEKKPLTLAAGAAALPDEKPEIRALLVNRLAVPKLEYLDLNGAAKSLEGAQPQPVLVLFWASWCPLCAAEMKALASRAADMKDLRILALAVDTAKPDPARQSIEDVRAALKERAWLFDAGFASQATVRTLAILESRAFYPERPLALPSSYLLAPDGRLCVIYHGAAGVDQLRKDAAFAARPPADAESAVFPFPGRSAKPLFPLTAAGHVMTLREAGYTGDARAEIRRTLDSLTDSQSATRLTMLRLLADFEDSESNSAAAIAAWKEALALTPGDAALHLALGASLWKAGQKHEAEAAFTRASPLTNDTPAFQNQLGKVWQALGEHARAREAFAAALAAAPESAETAFNLAVALQLSGDTASAIARYEAVLGKNPAMLDAASNLAWLLATAKDATHRQPARALSLAQQLAKTTGGQNPAVLDNLAAAQAANGDFPAAIATATSALALARAKGETGLAEEIARHLASYQKSQRWTE